MRRRATSCLAALLACGCLTACAPTSACASLVPSPGGGVGGALCHLAGATPGIGGALQSGCEVTLTPLKLGEWLAKKGWGALNGVLGEVPKKLVGAVADVVKDGADAALNGVSGWIASGAVWLVSKVAGLLQSTTSPNVTASWFHSNYAVMLRIAFTLALPLLLFSVARALFMRDPGELVRSVLVYLPLAALLTAGAVAVAQMGITITDSLSESVSQALGANAHEFFAGAAKGLVVLGAGTGNVALPGFVVAIAAIFAAFAAFVLWIELVLRSAAIYVVLFFMPLAFIAMIWPTTARLARRMVEILAAIILAKLVIVAIIALAASAMVHAGLGSNVDAAFAGIALMLLAIFAPWTLLRMVPLLEAAVVHHEGASRQARAWSSDRLRDTASEHIKGAFGEVTGAGSGGEGALLLAGSERQPLGASGAPATRAAGSSAAAGAGAAASGAAVAATVAGSAANATAGRARTGGAAAQGSVAAGSETAGDAGPGRAETIADTARARLLSETSAGAQRPPGAQGATQAISGAAEVSGAAQTPGASGQAARHFPTAMPARQGTDGEGAEGPEPPGARASAASPQLAENLQRVDAGACAGEGQAPMPMPAMPSELRADEIHDSPAAPVSAHRRTADTRPEVQALGHSAHHPSEHPLAGGNRAAASSEGPDELIPAQEIERGER